jgi:opacity protein-like surface antigen
MRILLFLALTLAVNSLNAQDIHLDLYGGVANYQGDLSAKRVDFSKSKPAIGLGLSYDITHKLIARAAATYMKVAGADATNLTNKDIFNRNLSFESSIWEAQLGLEYNFFDIEEKRFTPYAFAGIAAFHFSPYAIDNDGTKVFLRSLGTEGQGLPQYPEKTAYRNNQLAIPFGGGVKLALSDRLQVAVELGLRKLFTDYLDDVSGTYADSATLAGARGPIATRFAFRAAEINNAFTYPAGGSQRGNAENKDWYFTTGIKLSYSLGILSGKGSSRAGKSRTGCPVNIY